MKLRKELDEVKMTQVAFDDEEVEKDIFCIGASIVKGEEIIGAFSISMPKYRLTPEVKDKIIQSIKQTKEEIEKTLKKK